jgi:hypothetical protein
MTNRQALPSAKSGFDMVDELRYAEACLFLFYLHKSHIEEWKEVRELLVEWSERAHTLETFATLIRCSAKNTIESSHHLVPGLADYREERTTDDLFE